MPAYEDATTPDARRVADELRRAIDAGELRPGDPVTTGPALAQRFGVPYAAAFAAIAGLQRDGVLVAADGSIKVALPVTTADLNRRLDVLLAELASLRARVKAIEETPEVRVYLNRP
jgi:DNA-binding GntR family transcriptional regulator